MFIIRYDKIRIFKQIQTIDIGRFSKIQINCLRICSICRDFKKKDSKHSFIEEKLVSKFMVLQVTKKA